jgi:methylglutaconyl-CoA hydratase
MDTMLITRDGPLATVLMNRPAVHNAFNPQMIAELIETFRALGTEDGVRVVVLAGSGRSFCAGADVTYMRAMSAFGEAENIADAERLAGLFAAIQDCPKPVIARVQGLALGGGAGLVAAADIVVAEQEAQFGFTEAVLGIVPAVISPFVLAKIGPGAARELFLTGERFSAQRAYEIGLVQHVVFADGLDAKVAERVEKLLVAAPGSQAVVKQLLPQVSYRTPAEACDLTARTIAAKRVGAEGQEGLKAFLEKRKPNWRQP